MLLRKLGRIVRYIFCTERERGAIRWTAGLVQGSDAALQFANGLTRKTPRLS